MSAAFWGLKVSLKVSLKYCPFLSLWYGHCFAATPVTPSMGPGYFTSTPLILSMGTDYFTSAPLIRSMGMDYFSTALQSL